MITTNKGVCQDYAILLNALFVRLGYKSAVITGYTKNRNGDIGRRGHAWNVVNVDNRWRIYDPTWASGFMRDSVFHKKYNSRWSNVPPEEMIFI